MSAAQRAGLYCLSENYGTDANPRWGVGLIATGRFFEPACLGGLEKKVVYVDAFDAIPPFLVAGCIEPVPPLTLEQACPACVGGPAPASIAFDVIEYDPKLMLPAFDELGGNDTRDFVYDFGGPVDVVIEPPILLP